jgi:hypothetical protein
METGRRSDTVTVLFFLSREAGGEAIGSSTSAERFLENFGWSPFRGIKIAAPQTHITLAALQAFVGGTQVDAFQYLREVRWIS